MSTEKNKMIRLGIVAVAVLLVGLVGFGALASRSESQTGLEMMTVTPKGNSSVAEAREFQKYPVYSVGSSFDGLPLNAVILIDALPAPPDGFANNHVSFAYGTCEIPRDADEGSCSVPLTIQSWPACERGITLQGIHAPSPDEEITVRGVPALFFDDYRRLAIATGETTIFVWAEGRRQDALEAASRLQSVNSPVKASGNLPEPVAGALDGSLKC